MINQYNQFEYNRVLLSRDCYSQSIRVLFDYGQSAAGLRFVDIINSILNKVVKVPCSQAKSGHSSVQALCTLVIERTIKIFTTITLFLEEQKKREKQRKLDIKRRKELKAKHRDAKKKAEEAKPPGGLGSPAKVEGNAEEPQISSLAE